jgi:hypothetical protein
LPVVAGCLSGGLAFWQRLETASTAGQSAARIVCTQKANLGDLRGPVLLAASSDDLQPDAGPSQIFIVRTRIQTAPRRRPASWHSNAINLRIPQNGAR